MQLFVIIFDFTIKLCLRWKRHTQHITSYDILKARLSDDNMLEYGVTLSNLFNPSLSLEKKSKALDYMNEALEIRSKGKYHPLYVAANNNFSHLLLQ